MTDEQTIKRLGAARYVLSNGFPREHTDGKYVLAKDYDALREQNARLVAALEKLAPRSNIARNALTKS